VEQSAIEKEIGDKAREWINEYGEEFVVELIDVYLQDTPNRLAQMRQAFNGGDTETLIREAHTLKSSSANVGAMGLSALAREMESAGRNGKFDSMALDVARFEKSFALVKATLETLRNSAAHLVNQEW
jgi:HPt (histidine-containing phosphotransfer) domain-containing protein